MSVDANFGLCRKRQAGTSVHGPLSTTTMFLKQSEVDRFVNDYKGAETTSVRKTCIVCTLFVAKYW